MLVSHDLAVVAHLCDRIAVMNHGKILEVLGATELESGLPATPIPRRCCGRAADMTGDWRKTPKPRKRPSHSNVRNGAPAICASTPGIVGR